ncbi:MAG: hypothetical protein WCK53_12525 [Methanomicrobiales archaeon]
MAIILYVQFAVLFIQDVIHRAFCGRKGELITYGENPFYQRYRPDDQ